MAHAVTATSIGVEPLNGFHKRFRNVVVLCRLEPLCEVSKRRGSCSRKKCLSGSFYGTNSFLYTVFEVWFAGVAKELQGFLVVLPRPYQAVITEHDLSPRGLLNGMLASATAHGALGKLKCKTLFQEEAFEFLSHILLDFTPRCVYFIAVLVFPVTNLLGKVAEKSFTEIVGPVPLQGRKRFFRVSTGLFIRAARRAVGNGRLPTKASQLLS